MPIDFESTFKDLDGNDINEGGKVLTLGRLVTNALLTVADDERTMTGETKAKRYDLAMRVLRGDAALKAEELADIKKAIGKHYTPIIVGPAWKMLDPAE
jgi:hypothetical protein